MVAIKNEKKSWLRNWVFGVALASAATFVGVIKGYVEPRRQEARTRDGWELSYINGAGYIYNQRFGRYPSTEKELVSAIEMYSSSLDVPALSQDDLVDRIRRNNYKFFDFSDQKSAPLLIESSRGDKTERVLNGSGSGVVYVNN